MRVHLLPTLSRDNSYVGPHLLHRRTVEEPKAQWGREVGTSAGHSLQHEPLDTGPTAGHSSQCVCGAPAGHGEKRWRKRPRQRPDGCIVGYRKGTPTQVPVSCTHRCCWPRGQAGETPEQGCPAPWSHKSRAIPLTRLRARSRLRRCGHGLSHPGVGSVPVSGLERRAGLRSGGGQSLHAVAGSSGS